jgi:2-keto-3-deoxy-L-rhamnonate aldolase RhmA
MNSMRSLLDRKHVCFGAMVNLPTPALVELSAAAGFDWVFVDAEHELVELRDVYDLSRAADGSGVPLVARVPANRPELLLGFSEAGVQCVLAPHISSREDAELLVSSVLYPPLGRRGLHSRTRAGRYGLLQNASDYFGDHDSHVMPMAMIESIEAVANIPEIASTDGLELFLIGPGDISGSAGHPGRLDHPSVTQAVDSAIAQLTSLDRIVSILSSTPESTERYVQQGVRMPMCSTASLTASALSSFLRQVCDPDAHAAI